MLRDNQNLGQMKTLIRRKGRFNYWYFVEMNDGKINRITKELFCSLKSNLPVIERINE